MFKIGNIEIKNQVVMAPMAGITNMAFRKIIKDFGAGLVYSEMVSDKALCYGNTKTIDMLQVDDGEHPVSIQLFGGEVETMVKAAKFIDQHSNCDIIDINILEHSMNVEVSDEELARRKANWQPRKPRITTGYLVRYASMVTSADRGAILEAKEEK